MLLGSEIAQPSSAAPIQNQDMWGTGINTCALYKSEGEQMKQLVALHHLASTRRNVLAF
jgi:hypothetical protein